MVCSKVQRGGGNGAVEEEDEVAEMERLTNQAIAISVEAHSTRRER
jgi:hypothetical protein